jgi:hypothetical protein
VTRDDDNNNNNNNNNNVAITGDRNVIKNETEKILKYKISQQKYSACGM